MVRGAPSQMLLHGGSYGSGGRSCLAQPQRPPLTFDGLCNWVVRLARGFTVMHLA